MTIKRHASRRRDQLEVINYAEESEKKRNISISYISIYLIDLIIFYCVNKTINKCLFF